MRSEPEFVTEIYLAHFFVRQERFRIALCQYPAFVEDVGMVADTQHFPDIVVRDEHADILLCQLVDDALDYSGKQAQLGKTVGDDFRERPRGSRATRRERTVSRITGRRPTAGLRDRR